MKALLLSFGMVLAVLAGVEEQKKKVTANLSPTEIESIRKKGPPAFRELEAKLDPALREYEARVRLNNGRPIPAELQKAADLFNAAAGQYDACSSRLFWFTDFEAAKAEARRANLPILSLRLLGKLTDEYSCANSRFFRTLLYSDPAISSLLRQNYVLHWESVRPVPKVTIDFGDGRILHRTITGNSIHYILTPEGQPVDALPGLYQPTEFRKELEETAAFLKTRQNQPDKRSLLVRLEMKRAGLLSSLNADLQRLGLTPRGSQAARRARHGIGFPTSLRSDTQVEEPMMESLELTGYTIVSAPAEDPMADLKDPAVWEKIAKLHAQSSISPEAVVLVASKVPQAREAAQRARSKTLVETPLVALLTKLELSLAADTVRNQFDFRPKILAWLAEGASSLPDLNDRVYAQLFLTPMEDPWLGLRSDDVFSGLQNDGIQGGYPANQRGQDE